MNRSSRKKRRGVFLSLLTTLLAVFVLFQYSTIPEKAALLLEPIYVRELTNTTLLTRFIREKLDSRTLTQEELVRALRLLGDKEKEISLLQNRVRLLENEISTEELEKMEGTKTWVIHKSSRDVFLIKGGEDKGFKQGDVVISRLGEAIGYIEKVFPRSSRLSLFSRNNVEIEGILNSLNASVQLKGDGQNSISFLPRDMEVNERDMVSLQCLPEVSLGNVAHIRFDPRDPKKMIIVEPILPPSQIQSVMVLNGSGDFCGENFVKEKNSLLS